MDISEVMSPFFTVAQRNGTEGTEYVVTLNGEQFSVFDGDDSYWKIADLIDGVGDGQK